jgi:hypothetical protein
MKISSFFSLNHAFMSKLSLRFFINAIITFGIVTIFYIANVAAIGVDDI